MSDTWRQWEGNIVDGQFQLRRYLGGSDHSVVFLTERGQDEKAAIKFIPFETATAEAQVLRWKQTAQLSHPNLIKVFEHGRCHLAGMDLLYVVMEFAEENLAQFLPQRPLSPAETRDMLEPFLETLGYLHGKGLVHAHIRPGNILAIDDQLKLSSDTLLRTGESRLAAEKPDAYTPPEAPSEKVSPASDVWSLGITLVEALTQRAVTPEELALQGMAPEELAYRNTQVATQQATAVTTLPEPFLDITRHCLHRDPQRRWTVAEISARLNPPPTPPAPRVTAPVVSEAKTIDPTVAQTTPAKPALSVDPLSVPLSSVAAPPASQRQTLQNQAVSRVPGQQQTIPRIGAPARSYYIVIGFAVALIVSAALAIPRLRNHQSEAAQTSEIAASAPQQAVTSAPAQIEPSDTPKPSAMANQRSSAVASNQPTPKAPRQPEQRGAQDSLQTTSEKQPIKKSAASGTVASSAAPARSESTSSNPVRSAGAVNVASGPVARGEVLNQVLPEISQKSRNTIRGSVKVVIKVLVDGSGSVSDAEFASRGPSRYFADAALASSRRWDFTPAKVDGNAVPSEWLLQYSFTPAGVNVTPLPTKP